MIGLVLRTEDSVGKRGVVGFPCLEATYSLITYNAENVKICSFIAFCLFFVC